MIRINPSAGASWEGLNAREATVFVAQLWPTT